MVRILFGHLGVGTATELSTAFWVIITLLGSEEPHQSNMPIIIITQNRRKFIIPLILIHPFIIIHMTLNPPVNQHGQPLALPNERFILYRPNVDFDISIEGMGKKSAKGTAYLTNYRIIFVNAKPNQQFTAFDVPIANLYQEKVQFPLLGSTYLGGSSTPYMNLLPGNCHFKLYFKNGGCDAFIKILSVLIKEVRSSLNQHVVYEQTQFFNDMSMGKVNFNAYANPNDPSVIYTQQPNF